ncbi:uncharacterized protein N7473_004945 [Penicillium subrubescens]|uniref:uncharacterized protein n=1 Tax=Penicillium subrubescens TaxID=1316194 RepID=UPI0025456B0C|nr:uncharacterized protein N7473_004945 [Penicillium subrubescens]KAJ5900875.1 hypothetical protein N7473_004945 [Penicillium subrubescens]
MCAPYQWSRIDGGLTIVQNSHTIITTISTTPSPPDVRHPIRRRRHLPRRHTNPPIPRLLRRTNVHNRRHNRAPRIRSDLESDARNSQPNPTPNLAEFKNITPDSTTTVD